MIVDFQNGDVERWKLNMIAMGDAKTNKTAMALTVGTPTAIGA